MRTYLHQTGIRHFPKFVPGTGRNFAGALREAHAHTFRRASTRHAFFGAHSIQRSKGAFQLAGQKLLRGLGCSLNHITLSVQIHSSPRMNELTTKKVAAG